VFGILNWYDSRMADWHPRSTGDQTFDSRVILSGEVIIDGTVSGGGFDSAVTAARAMDTVPGISAAGNSSDTATVLSGQANVVTVVAPGTGVKLKPRVGTPLYVSNRGANPLLVYPASDARIEANAIDAPVSIIVGATAVFMATNATQFYLLRSDGVFA
jgi:hypothetical protein